MIAIVDYGVGNLFSLKSSFARIGAEAVVTGDASLLLAADRVILPGVGAFGDAMDKLRDSGLAGTVRQVAANGVPLLGICLGMQLLFERSYEFGVHEGLGLIPGEVQPLRPVLPDTLKVPQIGWNALHLLKPDSPLLANTHEGDHVYFVHSYHAVGCGDALIASAEYGVPVTAAVQRNNVFGTQFHPEKSGAVGLNMLRAFCAL